MVGQSSDPWVGEFSNAKLTFVIQGSQGRYIGTLTFVETNYIATAKVKEGILIGNFTMNASKFPFEAILEGNTLNFTTRGKHYSLVREALIEPTFVRSQFIPPPISESAYEIDYTNQPVWGNPQATVKVAFFQDFMCPHCASFTENIQPQLMETYKDNEEVAFFFFNFPLGVFGPPSEAAALASECVYDQDNTAFWDYKTVLMDLQGQINYTAQGLANLAGTYVPTVDTSELETCIEEERFTTEVSNDRTIGESIFVSSTPTVFVNGERVEDSDGWNDPTFPSIEAAIEDALSM